MGWPPRELPETNQPRVGLATSTDIGASTRARSAGASRARSADDEVVPRLLLSPRQQADLSHECRGIPVVRLAADLVPVQFEDCRAPHRRKALRADNFAERVHANQRKLRSNLKAQYDFVICGSGSSGSVVASRLAENPAVNVLLLEAGGDDEEPSVTDARQWVTNIGSERYWQFNAEPNPHLNGRAIPLGMGKALGGGSSINAMIWARGHKSDWDFFACYSRHIAGNSTHALPRHKNSCSRAPCPMRRSRLRQAFLSRAISLGSSRKWSAGRRLPGSANKGHC
jgi:GMC oxidoreductase